MLPARFGGALAALACLAACSDPAPSSPPPPPAPPPAAPVAAGPDLENGRYLATIAACAECHTTRAPGAESELDRGRWFAGGIPFEGAWGTVHAANVSAVAAAYEPHLLEAAIRGQLSHKFQMPTDLYAQMAKDDMRDLVAYLKSLSAVDVPPPENRLDPKFRPPPPLEPANVPETAPRGPTAERGAYLVQIAICKDCHWPRAADGSYDPARAMSGGGIAFRHGDKWLVPPNLTPDRETGLGTWTDDEIVRAIKTGVRKDGRALHPAMPAAVAYKDMREEDARAIVAYLRTLPPVKAARPPNGPYDLHAPLRCCFSPPALAEVSR